MWSSAEIDFRRRVPPRDLPELMDGDCSYEDFRGCLGNLEQVNRWLLGYRPTLTWLTRLMARLPRGLPDAVHIVDVGSGGGDLLRQIAGWARRHNFAVQLTGIDLNPYAARAAAEFTPKELGIAWVTGDALEYRPNKPADDLERSEWSCRVFGWVAEVVGWHRFVRHDGPVSFRRAFLKEDWLRLLAKAGVPREAATVEHWWPGRLCVGRWK